MRSALVRHDAIARSAVEGNCGVVVKMTGDGTHAAFEDPLDAIRATLQLQQALADPEATSGVTLSVRCGVHMGTVERRDNDYFGGPVNRAARIMNAAHGGQVLLSHAVVDRVRGRLPSEVSLRDLGGVRLKDLSTPERVYQLVHPQLRHEFPTLRSLEATPNNLPQQVSPFIGRERELVEITRLLPGKRLLTLVGVGGIGKTRLALQWRPKWWTRTAMACGWSSSPQSGTPCCADVGGASTGVQEKSGTPLTDTLCAHLKARQLLLVLITASTCSMHVRRWPTRSSAARRIRQFSPRVASRCTSPASRPTHCKHYRWPSRRQTQRSSRARRRCNSLSSGRSGSYPALR
jgi:hypothetical protein